MRDLALHFTVPLFMLVFAAAMLVLAHHTGNESLKTLADGIGGGGLTLLTNTARTQMTTNKITGGPVSIDQTPTSTSASGDSQ